MKLRITYHDGSSADYSVYAMELEAETKHLVVLTDGLGPVRLNFPSISKIENLDAAVSRQTSDDIRLNSKSYVLTFEFWSGGKLVAEYSAKEYRDRLDEFTSDSKVRRIRVYERTTDHILLDTIDVEPRWFVTKRRRQIYNCCCGFNGKCSGTHWYVVDRKTGQNVQMDVYYDKALAERQAEIYNRQGGPID